MNDNPSTLGKLKQEDHKLEPRKILSQKGVWGWDIAQCEEVQAPGLNKTKQTLCQHQFVKK